MKKITFIFIILITLIHISCKKEQEEEKKPDDNNPTTLPTNLPDGNFEQWTLSDQSTFEEPTSGWWTSLNILKNLGGPETLVKTADKNTGNYAAKLETKLWDDDLLITGLLVSGTFDFDAPNMIIQGKPFTEKPLKMKGYYKYTSVNADSAAIYANITKFNSQIGKRDTIAEASFVALTTVNQYTLFEMNFDYFFTDLTPDSITIVFSSSADGANFNGQAGSTLYIDDVSLVMPDKKHLIFY